MYHRQKNWLIPIYYQWLDKFGLKHSTEALIMAVQEQALSTQSVESQRNFCLSHNICVTYLYLPTYLQCTYAHASVLNQFNFVYSQSPKQLHHHTSATLYCHDPWDLCIFLQNFIKCVELVSYSLILVSILTPLVKIVSVLALCDSLCAPEYFLLLCALDFVFSFMDFYNSLNNFSPESAFESLSCKW